MAIPLLPSKELIAMNDLQRDELRRLIPAGRVVETPAEVDRLSKDFYWYSPILKRELESKSGEVAVQPTSVDEVRRVLRWAHQQGVPVTVRGAGTGNYGQCIPLRGGILLDLGALDRVLEIRPDGVAVCEPGARLGMIESAARQIGWELRCYPSTYQKASVAGFLAGGSGGIGSISHGLLRDNDTVRSMTILTLEAEPREVVLKGGDIFKALHAWGTTGVIVQVELALAPRVDWAQVAASFATFDSAFDFSEAMALDDSFPKRLVTCFEWPIPQWFAPLAKWVVPGQALAFFEVADSELVRFQQGVVARGGQVVFSAPYREVRRGAQLSDYTWNHTTLWALKGDPTVTYLQCGFVPERVREQMALLKARFGDEFLFHIEFARSAGVVVPGSIPIIRYTTDARLQAMIDYCGEIGVGVANPHINYLEGSGRWRPDDAKLMAKRAYDPSGLLNPGKMIGFKPASAKAEMKELAA
jgi:FAD/FMN-containing dehydrogenase